MRQVTPDDVNEIFFLRSDDSVMQYIDRPRAKTTADALEWIEKITAFAASNEAINWGICLRDEPKLLGNICLWQISRENLRAELGYALHPAQHRKGIMTEAIRTILDYGFNTMKLHSVEAQVNSTNLASMAVLEKSNFTREGYFRENHFYDGRFLDTAVYSLLATDNR